MIDISKIEEVLLQDGQWHKIGKNSFGIGDYVIGKQSQGGNKINFETNRGDGDVKSKAAFWQEDGRLVLAPMTSIHGYKTAP
jgi:hypothetical protein